MFTQLYLLLYLLDNQNNILTDIELKKYDCYHILAIFYFGHKMIVAQKFVGQLKSPNQADSPLNSTFSAA